MTQTNHTRKDVLFFGNHDNSSPFILGGIGLSLLGLLSFGLNRVLHALKGRKDVTMPRYDSRAALSCGPAAGTAFAAASKPANRQESQSGEGLSAKPTTEREITVRGVFKVIGRVERPAPDDQFVYLDE